MTDRVGRWSTWQVGQLGCTVAKVARKLGCEWPTVNDTVIANGSAMAEDPIRTGSTKPRRLAWTRSCSVGGPLRPHEFAMSIVDVNPARPAQLLDVGEGRSAAGPSSGASSMLSREECG